MRIVVTRSTHKDGSIVIWDVNTNVVLFPPDYDKNPEGFGYKAIELLLEMERSAITSWGTRQHAEFIEWYKKEINNISDLLRDKQKQI